MKRPCKKLQQNGQKISIIPPFQYHHLNTGFYCTLITQQNPMLQRKNSVIGGVVLKELKVYMPEYEKGQKDLFCSLLDKFEFVKANAIRAQKQAKANHTDNPSTSIHDLVTYLLNIRE
jgi:hypothetical protein